MPEDVKVPLILGRTFLSTARAKIDVYKRKITFRVGEEKIIFKSVKPASRETLVLNRSLDPFSEDYIELNDLNELFELRRNQGDDLMPTIEEGEVIEEFRTRDENLDNGIDDYPSYCDDDKKIHIDCAHNLKFSCMIVLEDMDAYRDNEMGDIIFGEPFLREIGIKTKWFEGIITLYNGDNEQKADSGAEMEDDFEDCILKTNTMYPSRRYGVSVPALTKYHRRLKINTLYPEDTICRIQDMESI
ncbi:hypothetical protein Tco_1533143 [Tanacetum coccineum]